MEACQCEEAERQRQIDEARAQMEQEQERELQVWAQAIMATQGGGAMGLVVVVVNPAARACEQCTESLRDIAGCMMSAKGKMWACVPCQNVCKACTWALGPVDAMTVMGSRMEGNGKLALRPVMKRRMQTAMNTSPRGREKRKKAHTITEEEEDNEDSMGEVFRVPKAMAEEQHDTLGMLTQMLMQMEEWMAAAEVREVARAECQERHMVVLEHLALERRRSVWEEERLEMERARMEVEQQWADDMWQLGTFAQALFIQGSLNGVTWRELEGAGQVMELEMGAEAEADDKDKDMQGEEE